MNFAFFATVALVFVNVDSHFSNDINKLNELFFHNLHRNGKGKQSDEFHHDIIKNQVDNYLRVIKDTYFYDKDPRTKRNSKGELENDLWRNDNNVWIFDSISPKFQISPKPTKNEILFTHDEKNWFVASLEIDPERLVIYKFNENNFTEIHEFPIKNGANLGTFTTLNGTYIVVAENTTAKTHFKSKTGVFLLNKNEELIRIQNLDVNFATDAVIWEFEDHLLMAIKTMEECIVYKWLGGHFDIVQKISNAFPSKLLPFVIGKFKFLALANSKGGGVSSHVDIFKYDYQKDRFVVHQKLSMQVNSLDLEFFCFKKGNKQEHFLLLASLVVPGQTSSSDTVIYKFVDNYFIPFQVLEISKAVDWTPSAGPNGEFILCYIGADGSLHVYQHNGWKFIAVDNSFDENVRWQNEIHSVSGFNFQNRSMLVVIGQGENMIYEINFKVEDSISLYYDEFLEWCKTTLFQANSIEPNASVLKTIRDVSSKDDAEIQIDNKVTFNNLTVVNMNTLQADTSESLIHTATSEIQNSIESSTVEYNKLEPLIRGLLSGQDVVVVEGSLLAENFTSESDIFFNSLISETVNGIDVADFFESIIDINHDAMLDKMEIKKVVFETDVKPKFINQHLANALLYKHTDLNLTDLQVNGNVVFESITEVNGKINGYNISVQSLLLKSGNQTLFGNLYLENITSNKLRAQYLNKLPLNMSYSQNPILIEEIDNLQVKDLVIGGFINNIDLSTLDNYALRKFGDQTLLNTYTFEELITNTIHTNVLEDININEFVLISEGTYFVSKDVQFVNNFTAKNLVVSERLNQVTVTNGKLDALLTFSDIPQNIKGMKSFLDLELLNPIHLKGKVINENLDLINPVSVNNEEIILVTNLTILENTTIEDVLNCKDIKTSDYLLGLKKLFKNGLSLHQEEIPTHLLFSQQINVNNINVENINSESPDDWVVTNEDELQVIAGAKIVEGDLHISGVVEIKKANEIDLEHLDKNTLKTEGNQVIFGKHRIKDLVAESVTSDYIQIGTSEWGDLIKSSNQPQIINGEMFLKSLSARKIVANNVYLENKVNGINFREMYDDTVKVSGQREISGNKIFKNLTVNNLISRRSINMNKIPVMIRKSEAIFAPKNVVELPNDLSIDKIYFEGTLNGINPSEFSLNWLEEGKNLTIRENQFFEKLLIFGKASVASNLINNVDLLEISENTVKVDESHIFDNIDFDENLISLDDITLQGHIEGVDLDNVVLNSGEEQVINDEIIFTNDVFIRGNLSTFGLINEFNLTSLCAFAFPTIESGSKNLILKGNAVFGKIPSIKSANGYNVGDLMNSAWFKNQETKISGNVDFQEVTFKEDVRVDGFVHGLKLEWLNTSYFSKTKNQTIAAKLDFADSIVFQDSLSSPKTIINGKLFDISLEEFQRTVLLDGIDQIFEETPFIDSCNVINLNGEFLVNDLNLETDVMRYDASNFVTGKKTFTNLLVDNLDVEKNFNVQNVDVLDWMKNAARSRGDNRIPGKTTFNLGATFKNGLNLKGKLNNAKFLEDIVLQKSIPQEISGKINFANFGGEPINFNGVKLTKNVNNIDMAGFLQTQAFKSENSVFQTSLQFDLEISANNVNFNYLYNGVNVSELITNLTNYINFNNYFKNYNTLLDINEEMKNALKVKANYIDSYKNLQVVAATQELFPLNNFDKYVSLVALYNINESHVIYFFKWNEEGNIYDFDSSISEIKFNKPIMYMAPLEYENVSFLFLEYEDFNDGNGYNLLDTVFIRKNESSYEILNSIPMNGTKLVIPLKSSKVEKCIGVIYYSRQSVDIFCDFENKIYLKQRLEAIRPTKIESIKIGDCFYLVVLDQELDSSASSITVWKFDEISFLYVKHQYVNILASISMSSVNYKNMNYLAIASGLWREELYPGEVIVMRFNTESLKYVHWQTIRINVPTQVEFAILPSEELVLYVLCENQLNPLAVFKYEGISKFNLAYELSIKAMAIEQFNDDNKHFLIGQSDAGFEIIQATLKGN